MVELIRCVTMLLRTRRLRVWTSAVKSESKRSFTIPDRATRPAVVLMVFPSSRMNRIGRSTVSKDDDDDIEEQEEERELDREDIDREGVEEGEVDGDETTERSTGEAVRYSEIRFILARITSITSS